MKKYLLITLAFLVVLSMTLTSCNTSEDVSKTPSDITEQQSNIPSETESDIPSDIPSDTPSQDVSTDLTEEDILRDKTVLYYSGENYTPVTTNDEPQGTKEIFSCVGGYSLFGYIKNNADDPDAYFIIGIDNMYLHSEDGFGGFLNPDDEGNKRLLRECGMVLSETHPFLEGEGDLPKFKYVGYATAETLRKLDTYKDYSIYLTWLNSPEDNDIWVRLDSGDY